MRVAPHRLYRKLLSEFLDRGISVLRVDFHGLGDSEGELAETELAQLYRQVQLGRHIDDVRAAMNFFEKEHRISRFVVGGLCGGALTGMLASEDDPRVVGLYALGIPVILDGTGDHAATHMTQAQLSSLRTKYARKLFDPKSWLRLLSLRSDFRLLWASFSAAISRRRRHVRDRSALKQIPAPATLPAANLNPLFARAFFRLLARQHPALLIFSGSDRLFGEYREKFADPWRQALERYRSHITEVCIEHANHTLSENAWIDETRTLTGSWLDQRFPRHG
jgi:alpha-beta hydrolase superfamily lysophospholipase